MWQLDNRTPFAAGQGWVRDRDGAEVWVVAVKCTFDVAHDGSLSISSSQTPVWREPQYVGEPGASSLRFESDMVLTKTTTDVVVAGHAHAPEGRPVTELDVGFRVGAVKKILRVFGDRQWGSFGLSAPEPFVIMPIVYERAFGGADVKSSHPDRDWDWRNPVGTGFAVASGNLSGRAAPNIEYPDQLIDGWKDRPPPAGFAPLGSHWQARSAFAGTYDDRWMNTRQPLLPADFDDRFYQCVPADQQAASFLVGGEQVTLLNLTPSGRVDFLLPTVELMLETHFDDGERRPHPSPKLHTVILEPDVNRVSLVWHSALECHAKVYQLSSTRIELRRDAADGDEAIGDNLLELV